MNNVKKFDCGIELKPCPFCGEKVDCVEMRIQDNWEVWFTINCSACACKYEFLHDDLLRRRNDNKILDYGVTVEEETKSAECSLSDFAYALQELAAGWNERARINNQ